jgi:hypothetical protein
MSKQLAQGRDMGCKRRYSSGLIAGYRLRPAMSCIAHVPASRTALLRFQSLTSTCRNLRCFFLEQNIFSLARVYIRARCGIPTINPASIPISRPWKTRHLPPYT